MNESIWKIGFALTTVILILSAGAPSLAQRLEDLDPVEPASRRLYVTLGAGVDFSQGDYGDVDVDGKTIVTNSGSVSVFSKIEWEPVTFRISVPFVVVDGSDRVASGEVGTEPVGNDAAVDQTDYGLGDVTTSLTYTYYPPSDLPALPTIDLTTRVKIPTAMSNLGTGNTDVTLQAELSKSIGRFSGFVGSGYRFRGGSGFDDTWLAFVGLGLRITDGVSLGVAYDYRQSSTDFSDDGHEISPYASFRLSRRVRLVPYGVIGLSEGSPDWGLGSTVAYTF